MQYSRADLSSWTRFPESSAALWILPQASGIFSVRQSTKARPSSADSCLKTKSTMRSAILRYPVNFPPAMDISPDLDIKISSLRESSEGLLPSLWIKGRKPAHEDLTSPDD